MPATTWYCLLGFSVTTLGLTLWYTPVSHAWLARQFGIAPGEAATVVVSAASPSPEAELTERIQALEASVAAAQSARDGDVAQMGALRVEFQNAIAEVAKMHDTLAKEAENLNSVARSLNIAKAAEPVGSSATKAPVAGSSSASAGTPGLVNLNTASADQLDTLPGIGPSYAQRIVEYREKNGPFTSVDQLMNVPGIGDATLAKIRDLVTV